MTDARALRAALAAADHVVLALPHTTATVGMIGAAELAALRPGCVLINLGRGTSIDEAALAEGESVIKC